MNPPFRDVENLAQSLSALAYRAVAEYAPLVDTVISQRSQDIQHIECLLGGLLDFCFDHAILLLYKKLCRHYYAIDPATAAWFVNAYRAM